MTAKTGKGTGVSEVLGKIFGRQIFIPIATLLLLTIFNLIMDPSFFEISLGANSAGNMVLQGQLITILAVSYTHLDILQQ